jgi:RNA polymerase sigma-70 factor (ECF subfamily)
VHALRADDARAPGQLWDRYSPAVRRLLGRTLGTSLDIDDLTQEVFLRVFVRLPALREPTALRPFVLSVAANVLKWELRRRWVGRRVRLSETGTLPDEILDGLTARERIAFVLRYMEEMTVHEVATTLSVSASTAKRWVNRGAAKVAERVGEDPELRDFFGVAEEKTHGP